MKLKDCDLQAGDLVWIHLGLHIFIRHGGTWGFEWYTLMDRLGRVYEYHRMIECEIVSRVSEALG